MNKITFGKYKGKTVKSLMMKQPVYIGWILSQKDLSGPLAVLKDEVIRLIKIFDSKPIQRYCKICDAEAKYCGVSQRSVFNPYWYCDECDPYAKDIIKTELEFIRSYREAIDHCERYSVNKKSALIFIKAIATAKGLGKRLGKKELDEFFG